MSEGALLTPSAGAITPTDSVHHVAAGTISSIATTNLDSSVIQPLILIADGAITITLGATIVGRTTALATNDAIIYLLDGGVWHEAPARALIAADIPNLNASKITAGLLALARGGTNADLSATGGASKFLSQASAGAAITVVQPAAADLSDFIAFTAFTPARAASAGTWTVGTVQTARYGKIGKRVTVLLEITGSSVSATPVTIGVTIPGSFIAANTVTEPLTLSDNATARTGSKYVLAGGTSILMTVGPMRTGTWATAVTATDVSFSFTFEVQ